MNETYKLIVGGNNITSYVGGLSWQNSIDELATKMSFEVAKSDAFAKNKLSELNKVKESFSIEIIESINSYTRAGSMITVDDVNYLIESTDHSIKNGVHYVKLGLRKFG